MIRLTVALLGLSCCFLACGSDADDEGGALACDDPKAPSYESFGQEFFETHCTSCHSSENSGAARNMAPPGYDFDSQAGVQQFADSIADEVKSGGMPPAPNQKPSAAEIEKLDGWLGCGAP